MTDRRLLLNLDTSPAEVERIVDRLEPDLVAEAAALRATFGDVIRAAVDVVDRQRVLNSRLRSLFAVDAPNVDGEGDLQNAVEERLGVAQIRWAFAALDELANGEFGRCYAMSTDDLRALVAETP